MPSRALSIKACPWIILSSMFLLGPVPWAEAGSGPGRPVSIMSQVAEPPVGENPGVRAAGPGFIGKRAPGVLRASDFEGEQVYGPSGGSVGEVQDVLFGPDGRITGLVIEIGGFLGVGAREVALPLHAFRIDPATTATSGTVGGLPASTAAGAATRQENRISPVVVPERITLRIPEDSLRSAPRFEDDLATKRQPRTAPSSSLNANDPPAINPAYPVPAVPSVK